MTGSCRRAVGLYGSTRPRVSESRCCVRPCRFAALVVVALVSALTAVAQSKYEIVRLDPQVLAMSDNGSGSVHWFPYHDESGHYPDIMISADNGSKQISETFDVTVLDSIAAVPLRWVSAALILIAIGGPLVFVTLRRRNHPPTS